LGGVKTDGSPAFAEAHPHREKMPMTAHPLSGQRSVARVSRFAGGGRAALWLGFFALVLSAWGVMMWISAASQLPPGSEVFGADYWRSICSVSPGIAGFPAVFGMWAIMSAAMMAPTAMPAFKTYLDLGHAGAGDAAGFWALVGAYLIAWLVFSVAAAGLQLGLASAGWLRPDGVVLVPGATAALLVLAGLYQLSPAKAACLSKCRAPLTFFVANWRDGTAGAAAMGLRLGLVCVGCCWALMLLAFVGGTMNLAFMGLATLVMVLEKLPDVGRLLTRPLAAALIVAGLADALRLINVI
jgi:predicted metal-binding membrane protein